MSQSEPAGAAPHQLMKPDPSLPSSTGDDDSVGFVQQALAEAREYMDMELSFVSEVTDTETIYRFVNGDAAPGFGLESVNPSAPDESEAAKATLCYRMLQGDAPSLIPDVETLPAARGIAAAGVVGAYVGVPIQLSDGTAYGALCCVDRSSRPDLSDRDTAFMRVLARLIADSIERRDKASKARRAKEHRIEQAATGEAISVVVQPIVDLFSGCVVGVEALSRFDIAPHRTPDVWFAEAAEVGAAVELEIAAICRALEAVPLIPADAYLALNLSPVTLLSGALVDALSAAPLRRLVLELTEHAPVEDYGALRDAIMPLRSAGVRLAIDDAGAGFSSFSHIVQMTPDIIKLDMGLTRDVDRDPVRRSLTAALISFAGETGAAITAEGIETRAELEALRELGAASGQGFYLGRPAPLSGSTLITSKLEAGAHEAVAHEPALG